MALVSITLTMEGVIAAELADAIAFNHPIPIDAEGVSEFTKNQWGKEYLRRLCKRELTAYRNATRPPAAIVDDGAIS